MLVVHDLVADVDRRTEFLQRPFDDFDGAHHARAKTARLGQYHFHQDLPVRHRFAFVFGFNVFAFKLFAFKFFAFNSTFGPAASRRKAARGRGAFEVIYVARSGCGSSANPFFSSLYLANP
jgi:hypothetical protein